MKGAKKSESARGMLGRKTIPKTEAALVQRVTSEARRILSEIQSFPTLKADRRVVYLKRQINDPDDNPLKLLLSVIYLNGQQDLLGIQSKISIKKEKVTVQVVITPCFSEALLGQNYRF